MQCLKGLLTAKSSLSFACSMVSSVSCSHIYGSVHLASDIELTGKFACNVVFPDSWFEVAIYSTFAICRGA